MSKQTTPDQIVSWMDQLSLAIHGGTTKTAEVHGQTSHPAGNEHGNVAKRGDPESLVGARGHEFAADMRKWAPGGGIDAASGPNPSKLTGSPVYGGELQPMATDTEKPSEFKYSINDPQNPQTDHPSGHDHANQGGSKYASVNHADLIKVASNLANSLMTKVAADLVGVGGQPAPTTKVAQPQVQQPAQPQQPNQPPTPEMLKQAAYDVAYPMVAQLLAEADADADRVGSRLLAKAEYMRKQAEDMAAAQAMPGKEMPPEAGPAVDPAAAMAAMGGGAPPPEAGGPPPGADPAAAGGPEQEQQIAALLAALEEAGVTPEQLEQLLAGQAQKVASALKAVKPATKQLIKGEKYAKVRDAARGYIREVTGR